MEGNSPVISNTSTLGIHIDGDYLNIVHLEQSTEDLKVLSQAAEPLEEGIIEDDVVIDTQYISQKIQNFIKAGQTKANKIVISLPCSAVRLKPCEFPVQSDEKLYEEVEEQIGRYSLFGGQEAIFDYCTFEEKDQSSNKQMVLQAITTRQISDSYLEVAHSIEIKLESIEPSVLAILKLVFNKPSANHEGVSLLLVLDSTSGSLSVFKNGLPQLCQNLSLGTKDLLRDTDSFSQLTENTESILKFAHSLADSQQLALTVAASCRGEQLDKIVEQLKQRLSQLTIEHIDQSEIVKQYNIQGIDGQEVPLFALASALTSFDVCKYNGQMNLVSQQSVNIQKTQKELVLTARVVVTFVLLFIAAVFPLKTKIKSVEADLTETAVKVTGNIPMREKINNTKNQMSRINSRLKAYSEASGTLTILPWPKVISVIGSNIPGGIRITDFTTTDKGGFTLIGKAIAEGHVHKFARKLQKQEIIEYADVEEIEYDDNSNSIIVDYKISGQIKLPESNL